MFQVLLGESRVMVRLAKFFGKFERGEMRGGCLVENEVAVDLVGDQDEVVVSQKRRVGSTSSAVKTRPSGFCGLQRRKTLVCRGDGVFHGVPIEAPAAVDHRRDRR